MNVKMISIAGALIALAGCGRSGDEGNVGATNADQAAAANDAANSAADLAADPASDQTSPQSAAVVLNDYAALAAKGSFGEASKYWTNTTAAAQFAASIEDYPKVEMTAGKPGTEEGAAGSSFIDVPLTLDLTLRSGSPYQMVCKASLRRVNDVPGSTIAQRRWHIDNIGC